MKSKRGFSLVEAMIALGILSVGLTGLAMSFQAMISKTVASRNQAQASIIAQSVLSELSDSDPAEWVVGDLAEDYLFDFDGNRVSTPEEAYYQIDLGVPVKDLGWWNVAIGVTWAGWRAEQDKAGFGAGSSAEFAYVLDASIAPYTVIDSPL